MAEAGWFRDPQDPNSEVYFDGQSWTSYRRPVAGPPVPPPVAPPPEPTWSMPAPIAPPAPPAPAAPAAWSVPAPEWGAPPVSGEWNAPPGAPVAPWGAPPPPRKRRGRLIAIAAVLVLAAGGVVAWLAWPSDNAPSITYAGKAIDHPERVLTSAEAKLADYVKSRHGARNAQTRCYFERPKTPASGTKKTDIAAHLACGPVLFVDGDTGKAFVSVAVAGDASGKKATLTLPNQLTDLAPQAAPTGVTLTRPDGATAPAGSGGLKVPDPPASQKDIVATVTLGPTPAPKALTGARMVSRTTGVVLTAAGQIPRYGSGDEARSAPAGQKLIAFQVDTVAGDVTDAIASGPTIVIDGGTSKPVPGTSGGDEWIVVAVPEASSAKLRLDDGGFSQTLSLPDGKPGAENLAVLSRSHRQASAVRSVTVKTRISNGSASANLNLHARMREARVDFWAPGNSAVHAPDGRHALLTTDLTYTDPNQPGDVFGFEPALLRLRLPTGQLIKPRNVARHKNKVYNVFIVPAGFTKGTLVVAGSERVGGVTLRIVKVTNFPISISAG